MTILHFPPQAIALAHALTLQPELWQRPQVEGVTIDGPDSRDLDDAIWIETTTTGAILSVHIADVSELVAMGSILDRVAIARTTTQYFKTGNAPMLPRPLSEDKLSLLEYQDRPTLTVRVTLNRNAEIEHTEIFESWLRSRRKFHYAEAERVIKDPNDPFSELLQTAFGWAESLYRNRLNAGAIGGTLTAQGDWLTEEGSLIQGQRHSSHLLIQEFMILANRAVAQWLAAQDVPMLYRNHTARAIAPDRETMYKEMLLLRSAGDVRKRMSSWLNRAEYGPALVGHFALNLPAYTHFTSPIRRLADLINHRIVKAKLRGQHSPYTKAELEQLGKHIGQVARELEQETSDYFKEKHQAIYKTQVQDSAELQKATEKEFSRLLKFGLEKQELETLIPELKTRLAARRLQLLDLYLLIFQTTDKALQQEAFECIQENVQDAASIVSMATAQQEGWDSFDYVDIQHSQTAPFYTWLEVKIKGNVLTTVHPSEHLRKQPARHQACLSWIEAYLQDALVSPDRRVEPESPEQSGSLLDELEKAEEQQKQTKASKTERHKTPQSKLVHPILKKQLKDGQLFVSLLMEVCQGLGLQNPEFKFHKGEDGFTCECEIEAMNQRLMGTGTATKKQRAKHLAARDVLEQLQAIAEQKWGEWSAGGCSS